MSLGVCGAPLCLVAVSCLLSEGDFLRDAGKSPGPQAYNIPGTIGQGPHANINSRPGGKAVSVGQGPGPGSYDIGGTLLRSQGGVTMAGRPSEKSE